MRLSLLREFCVLVNCKNFTHAADKLFIAPSTLSNHMKQLENEIGFALLDKKSPSFLLTSEGCEFLSSAQIILEEWDRVLSKCRESKHRVALRLQTSKVLKLDEILHSRLSNHPSPIVSNALLDFVGCDELTAVESLLEGRVDLSFQDLIRGGSVAIEELAEEHGVSYFHVASLDCVFLANHRHALARSMPISIKDLDRQTLLIPIGAKSQESFGRIEGYLGTRGAKVLPRYYQLDTINAYYFADAVLRMDSKDSIIWFHNDLLQKVDMHDKVVLEFSDEKIVVDYFALYDPSKLSDEQLELVKALETLLGDKAGDGR